MSDPVLDRGGVSARAQRPVDGLLRAGLIALLIASTMNGVSFEWRVSGMELTLRPDQIVLLFLLPIVVLASILDHFRFHLTSFEWVVAGFVASNLAASLFPPSRSASVKAAILLAAYATMYFVVRQILTNRTRWVPVATKWACGLGIAQAAYCLIGLVLYSFGYAFGGLQIGHLREGSVAIKGTFWEANLLGAYLGLIAVFLTVRYLFRTERRGGGTDLCGLFIATLALPLTVTRAAGLALVLGMLAIALVVWIFRREILEWKSRTGKIVVTLAAVLLLTVTAMDDFVSSLSRYPNFLLERWIPISSSAIDGGPSTPGVAAVGVQGPVFQGDVMRASRSSVEGRVQAWTVALEGWRDRPILGHGTLAGTNLVKDGWWYSSLVQALYDTGLVGFLVVLWIHVGAIVLPAWSWLRTRQSASNANLLGFSAGNAVLAFSSQFSSFLFVGFPWVFMGLSMAAVQAQARREHVAHQTRRARVAAVELVDERTATRLGLEGEDGGSGSCSSRALRSSLNSAAIPTLSSTYPIYFVRPVSVALPERQ